MLGHILAQSLPSSKLLALPRAVSAKWYRASQAQGRDYRNIPIITRNLLATKRSRCRTEKCKHTLRAARRDNKKKLDNCEFKSPTEGSVQICRSSPRLRPHGHRMNPVILHIDRSHPQSISRKLTRFRYRSPASVSVSVPTQVLNSVDSDSGSAVDSCSALNTDLVSACSSFRNESEQFRPRS
ncbi:hypothetical protein EVAR_40353_1 [Eumeta japonica]|uniref:Uncharacterized protein n=1 Tax=Eumeta variegata TaxID=151549 RepID=A0A4C1XKS6_EUMVA|nr:hypothetical protein EVAR_40353_1 [Eumeta japonica]